MMRDKADLYTCTLPGLRPEPKKPGRKPENSCAMTSAERKRNQRNRDRDRLLASCPADWDEVQCLAVLSDKRHYLYDLRAKAAWQRLGELRGYW